jgi:hypothetical protein
MTKLLWEILVPTQWNGGKPIRTRHHKEWDKRVRSISNGLTILHPAKGHWISPEGILHEERMIPVRIWCTKDEINKIMDMTAEHYKQDAVMAYCVASDVLLKSYTDACSTDKPVRDSKKFEAVLKEALSWKHRCGMYGELYITKAPGIYDIFYLQERSYPGVEVEWRHRMDLTRAEAKAVVAAGIADAWFDCLKEKAA